MAKILKDVEVKSKLDLGERLKAPISVGLRTLVHTTGGVLDRAFLESQDQAQAILEEAKAQALKVRQEAEELLGQVESEREQARQEGFEAGRQEGLANAMEMLVRVKELRSKLFADNEKEILRLVFEIARKIIDREFREDDTAVLNIIRLALSDAVGEKVIVRVNPEDYELVKAKEPELLQACEDVRTLSVRQDDQIKPHGCLVETEIGAIDAQLETQLGAIKKALGLK
ncbi:MAG: hypothetical protein KDK66_05430 [Deltaproteobacteria bacterium]|nr:hypothetical protein [Deltaproteobacteria bacterium]